jgi:alpha-glucosidase
LKTGKEGEILEVPELAWYNGLPTVWDDTKVLEGTMESYATIARKRNNEWYIGSLNGDNPRTVNWLCSFLDANKKYVATIYTDDPSVNTPTKVKITSMNIDSRSVIKLPVAARNAIAIHIVAI